MVTSAIEEVLGFVWHIAQMETVRLSHEYIDTEHVLMSLVQTRRCAAYSLLSEMRAFPSHIYLEIERRVPPGPAFEPAGVPRPISPKVKKLWDRVPEMITSECQGCPVTVVLLVAMLNQKGTLAHNVLSSFGVTEGKVLTLGRQLQMD
jgi:ATP-dependent Clp protease ATP-binding subunit ClpA